MDLPAYIRNGTVIDYYLGHLREEERLEFEIALELYPQLKQELHELKSNLDTYLENKSAPKPELKEKIWATLHNIVLEKDMNMSCLPLLNKYSDHKAWKDAVAPLLPKALNGDIFAKVLTQSDTVTQMLIMTSADVPEEIHEDVLESFMILEGECECHIGDKIVRLKAGNYMEIPLHEHHDVKVLSKYVVAVMQRIAV